MVVDHYVEEQGSASLFVRLVKQFGFQLEYRAQFELWKMRNRILDVKFYTEYHGARKHFDDPILKQKHHTYPVDGVKFWKRSSGMYSWQFDDHDRICEEFRFRYHREIKENQRVFDDSLHGSDDVLLPEQRMDWEAREVDGEFELFRVPTYYI